MLAGAPQADAAGRGLLDKWARQQRKAARQQYAYAKKEIRQQYKVEKRAAKAELKATRQQLRRGGLGGKPYGLAGLAAAPYGGLGAAPYGGLGGALYGGLGGAPYGGPSYAGGGGDYDNGGGDYGADPYITPLAPPPRGGGNNQYMARYDPAYLTGIVPAAPPRRAGPAPGRPLSPAAQRFSASLASASAAAAARSALGGQAADRMAAAEALVYSAAQGRGSRVADAFAAAAALNQRDAFAEVLAGSASQALALGQVDPWAQATANAFLTSKKQGSLRNFGLSMADAVSRSGGDSRYAFGEALASAIGGGGDAAAAVAEATAEVFCAGEGDYASAWSSAFAVALSQDENGCLVLSKARALATASCGGGAFDSTSDTDATSKVLGFCGLFAPGAGPQFSINGSDGGSTSLSG
ncbi:MAG: hypothetical protein J3K34DRAFT_510396 [Monoraphidium minutum]|nr:MAG: hypothetical protein J3K34DRAFT_510396 [Monoraphidium minutum]